MFMFMFIEYLAQKNIRKFQELLKFSWIFKESTSFQKFFENFQEFSERFKSFHKYFTNSKNIRSFGIRNQISEYFRKFLKLLGIFQEFQEDLRRFSEFLGLVGVLRS
jgi:hypothetical protein